MDTTFQTNRRPITDLVARQQKLPPKRLTLTPADASAIYGISKRALKRAWGERRLPYYKLGHRTVVLDVRDIEAFLAKCRVDALHA